MKLNQILTIVSSSILLSLSMTPNYISAQTEGHVEIAQRTSGWLRCTVSGLKQGQLAVRKDPAGAAIVGLNNGNTVLALTGTGKFVSLNGIEWLLVKVIQGPNNRVNNREGWVNSNYLDCEPPPE